MFTIAFLTRDSAFADLIPRWIASSDVSKSAFVTLINIYAVASDTKGVRNLLQYTKKSRHLNKNAESFNDFLRKNPFYALKQPKIASLRRNRPKKKNSGDAEFD